MTAVSIRRVGQEEWWDLVEDCAAATFFHTPLWHELVTRARPELADRSLGLYEGERLIAVLPMVGRSGGLVSPIRLESTYAGCYGGVVSRSGVPTAAMRELYEEALSSGAVTLAVAGNPFDEDASPDPNLARELSEDFTQVIDLRQEFDEIVSAFSSGRRSGMHKAEREGVKVRRAEGLEDYEAYYKAYEASLERWGEDATSGHPWRLFHEGCGLAGEYPEQVRLWLAEVDGELASGAWTFYWGRHVVYWHGASHEEFFDYRPNNLLHPVIMRSAKEEGYDVYDFNPSGGHGGVVEFKDQFGAEKRTLKRWKLESRIHSGLRKLRDAIRALWGESGGQGEGPEE